MEGQDNVAAGGRWKLIFRSLKHRNYRLFFMGHGTSLVGTWMQMVAAGWLAYELTEGMPERTRAVWLGVVAFSGRIPTFILAPLGGVLVDRWNRRRLVIITQILAMVQALALAGLTLAHVITLGQLILLSLVLGLINALDVPARQSFMVETLDRKEDLGNAIALNSSLVNGARIIGPAVAGVLLKFTGAGVCFLINGLSYVAVVGALLAMTVKPSQRQPVSGHVLRNLADGFRTVFGFAPMRDVLFLLALVSLSGASYPVLLPIFAEGILHQGSGLYAALFSAAGFGALAGAIFLAMRESPRGLLRWIAVAPSIFAVGLIGLGLSPWAWLSLLAMPVIGFGMIVQLASSNTLLQTLVDDHMRGRLMSFYSMSFMGMVPIGSLLAGFLANLIGAPATVILNGVACLVGSAVFLSRRRALGALIRPIFVSKGIIQPAGE